MATLTGRVERPHGRWGGLLALRGRGLFGLGAEAGRPTARGGPPLAVAQVISRFGGGGAERLAYNLAVGMAAAGARSFAVALRRADLDGVEVPRGVSVLEFGAEGPLTTAAAMLRFRQFVQMQRIDVVHIHGHGAMRFCALALLGLRRPRLAFTLHAPEYVLTERGLDLAATRWAIGRCDRVYGPSQEVADELTRRGRMRRPAEVFRNGVAETPAASAQVGPPVIVWAARLAPTKDPQMMVRAAAKLRDAGLIFRVILAGEAPGHLGWYGDETRALVRELGLERIVEMPGWVTDTVGLFERASIAVQSSSTEGLSLSLLEQMMAGLAVVATDVGDTRAAVQDGRTGVLIRAGDEAALVDALRRLILEPRWRAELGRNAREAALSEFSLKRMARRAEITYLEIAVHSRGRRLGDAAGGAPALRTDGVVEAVGS